MFVAKQNFSPLERLSEKSLQRPTTGRVSKAHDSSSRRGTAHSTADDRDERDDPERDGHQRRDRRDATRPSAPEPRGESGDDTDDTVRRLQDLLDQERSASMRVRARMREEVGDDFQVHSRASQRLREHIDAQVASSRCPPATNRLDFYEELDVSPGDALSESAHGERPEAPESGVRRLNLPDDPRARHDRNDDDRDDEAVRPDPLDLLG